MRRIPSQHGIPVLAGKGSSNQITALAGKGSSNQIPALAGKGSSNQITALTEPTVQNQSFKAVESGVGRADVLVALQPWPLIGGDLTLLKPVIGCITMCCQSKGVAAA